jgi:hypothetical protein
MIKRIFLRTVLGAAILGVVFFAYQSSRAQSSSDVANSPDAIAVRIVPNVNHYSISRWYASQNFQGSPQSLLVDGYEAIRDGRTVYVNAANVNQASNPPSIYTNIYLISYNQNPAPNTVDILGQIVTNWKFNDGLVDINPSPSCSISSLSCASDTDCSSDELCGTTGIASSSCQLKIAKNCSVDADCPANFFCDSLKSKITRDVKRVGELVDLQTALANFKTANGNYPTLSAGTYLPYNSVSLWPSWSQSLLTDLAVSQTSVDPINRLGYCPGYDPATCWNKDTQKFISTSATGAAVLPDGSHAFAYSTNNTGSNYNLCATLETRDPYFHLNYHFTPNDPGNSACTVASGIGTSGQAADSPPQLVASALSGEAGQEFDGFIKVVDPDSDPLSWSLNTSGAAWTGWQNSGQSTPAPVLVDTSNPNQKKVYATLAGQPGVYNVSLIVNDGRGEAWSSSTMPLTILSPGISIQAEDAEYNLNSATPFSYNLYFSGDSLSGSNPSYSIATGTSGDLLGSLNKTFSVISASSYEVSYSGNLPASLNLSKGGNFTYKVTVTDKYSHSATKSFTIKIIATPLSLNFNCASSLRLNQPYNCVLDDPASGISYTAVGLLPGLQIASSTITGTVTMVTSSMVMITGTNQYGAKATSTFNLQSNTYCGDGILQTPNTEGRGGLYNDGYEDCDGSAGVTTSVAASKMSLQYGCQTTSTTTFPILSNDQCVFKSPTAGGGYCGDGYCEVISGESYLNCPQDCSDAQASGKDCQPNCAGRSCGDDGCGGKCGVCPGSENCSSSGNCIGSQCSSNSDCNNNNPCSVPICSSGVCTYANYDNSNNPADCTTGMYYDEIIGNRQLTPTYGTTTAGTCHILGTKTCSNQAYGACSAPDPRPKYCIISGTCEGQKFDIGDIKTEFQKAGISSAGLTNSSSVCSGTCTMGIGNGSACLGTDGKKIYTKTCKELLGDPWVGTAPCNGNCTGYTTSTTYCTCTPTCSGSNANATWNYVCGSADPNHCPDNGTMNCGDDSQTLDCHYGTCQGTETRTCSSTIGTWNSWSTCAVNASTTCAAKGYVCGSNLTDDCGMPLSCGANTRRGAPCAMPLPCPSHYTDTCSNGHWVLGTVCGAVGGCGY